MKRSANVLRPAFSLAVVLSIMIIDAGCKGREHRAELRKRFQEEVEAIAGDHDLPGMTAAYILADDTVEVFATGFADVERKIPMGADSRMLAASIGKTFTGALVLDLVREGRLDLDAPVKRYLGERHWFSRLPNHDSMTLRHLLTHSSGIEDHVYSPKFARAFGEQLRGTRNVLQPEELVSFVLDAPARFEPGSDFHYSDTGYILVGLIVEKVTGGDLFVEIQKRFSSPLGLTLTEPSAGPNLPGLAAGYLAEENPFGLPRKTILGPGRMAWNPALEWAGGGFISNSRDLAIWGKALYGGRALSGNYLKDLLRGIRISPTRRYGIATVIDEGQKGMIFYAHRGWIPGYCSSLQYYPKHKAAVAFQINTDIGIIDSERDVLNEIEERLARILFHPSGKTGESP